MRRRAFLAGSAASAALAAMRPALGTTDPGGASMRPLLGLDHGTRIPGLAADGQPNYISLSNSAVQQGGVVRVTTSQGTGGSMQFLGRDFVLLPLPAGGLQGFVSVWADDAPGASELLIDLDGPLGPEAYSRSVEVLRTTWTVEYIYVPPTPPGEPNPLDPQEGLKESQRLGAVYGGRTAPVWKDTWAPPVLGLVTADRVSAYFGEQRSFNGGPVQGHHGGTDLVSGFGQPIIAVNDGTVVLSDLLVVRGNMVIVDHGGGVFSGYAHLSGREVELGATVAQGDVVGYEGATGLVTGSHLHWEMCAGGVLVDGLRWLDGSQGF